MMNEEERQYMADAVNALFNCERKYITLRHWLRDRHPESHEEYFNTHYEPVEGSWITNDEGKVEPSEYEYVGKSRID